MTVAVQRVNLSEILQVCLVSGNRIVICIHHLKHIQPPAEHLRRCFLRKQSTVESHEQFSIEAPYQMFDRILNMPPILFSISCSFISSKFALKNITSLVRNST